jgi:hypothetical protein
MSSLYHSDEVFVPADPPRRSLFVNMLLASRAISQLIRRLWSRATSSVFETPPVETGEDAGEPTTEFTPAAEPAVSEPEPVPAEPTGPPRFETRVLWTPKRGNDDKEWEDGFAMDAIDGVLAVADGAGDGIFSKLWADLLLKSFLAGPVPLDDLEAVEPWIQDQRRAWFAAIRYPEQRWSIQAKIDRSCGAATFMGFRLDPTSTNTDAAATETGWIAWAVGDICLFHVRDGHLIASFPMGASADFNLTPQLYQSKAMRPTPQGVMTRGELRPDDLIVFATDAVAQRLLAEVESGTPPDWGRFWDLAPETWRQEIESFRDQNAIVNDDCTLVVLRLPCSTPEAPAPSAPEPAGESSSEEAFVRDVSVGSEIAAPDESPADTDDSPGEQP